MLFTMWRRFWLGELLLSFQTPILPQKASVTAKVGESRKPVLKASCMIIEFLELNIFINEVEGQVMELSYNLANAATNCSLVIICLMYTTSSVLVVQNKLAKDLEDYSKRICTVVVHV